MKISLAVYLTTALFGSGLFFFRLYSYLAEREFRLTLGKAAASVWVSTGLSALTFLVHRRGMLLSRHLLFDVLGMLFWASMLACARALAEELQIGKRLLGFFTGGSLTLTPEPAAALNSKSAALHRRGRRPQRVNGNIYSTPRKTSTRRTASAG